VSGEGVQQALLKMIEGSIMRVPSTSKRKHPGSDMQEIDTRSILFICGGAFVGIDKLIKQRTGARSVGFHANVDNVEDNPDVFHDVTTKDLIKFGLIPEFVGRFGLITNVDELEEDQLVQILTDTKNSTIKQYQYMFELDGINLSFDQDALREIAKRAKDLKTNARGLKNIIEKVLMPYQFDAVDLVERGLKSIHISKDTIDGSPATMIFDKKKNEQKQQSTNG
jgi:ATP-dependent Clp protease ATP-binding subunit ClpX